MALIPRLRANKPLERGQTAIFNTLNSSIGPAKPIPPLRLGPRPKAAGQADTVLGRRLIGGINEKQTIKLFANVQLSQYEDAEPGDTDITQGRVIDDESDLGNEYEYIP